MLVPRSRLRADGDGGLNGTGLGLQIPIATAIRGPGEIIGSGHVSPGQGRNRVDEGHTLVRTADLTPIQQQIAIRRQGRPNCCKRVCMIGQRVCVNPLPTKGNRPHVTMADHMDRIDIGPVGQIVGHLLKAVGRRIEDNGFRRLWHAGHQGLIVRHRWIDEDDLNRSRVHRLRRCGRRVPLFPRRLPITGATGVLRPRQGQGQRVRSIGLSGWRWVGRVYCDVDGCPSTRRIEHKPLLKCEGQRAEGPVFQGRLIGLG